MDLSIEDLDEDYQATDYLTFMKELKENNPKAYNQLKAFSLNSADDSGALKKSGRPETERLIREVVKTGVLNYQATIQRECLDLKDGKVQLTHLKKCIESLNYKSKAELSEIVDRVGRQNFKTEVFSDSDSSLQDLVMSLRFLQETKKLMKGLELLSLEGEQADCSKVIDLVDSVSHLPMKTWMFGNPSLTLDRIAVFNEFCDLLNLDELKEKQKSVGDSVFFQLKESGKAPKQSISGRPEIAKLDLAGGLSMKKKTDTPKKGVSKI